MKLITLFISILLIACKSNEMNPSDIIGKWEFTRITQYQNTDGSWTPWRVNPTFLKEPPLIYEFTNNSIFLKNGYAGADCCNSGNKYRIANNEIIFSDFLVCPTVRCGKPQNWIITEIKGDTLILEEFNTRSKYVKIK